MIIAALVWLSVHFVYFDDDASSDDNNTGYGTKAGVVSNARECAKIGM